MKNKLIAILALTGSAMFANGALAQDTTTPPAVETDPGAVRELRLQFREQRASMMQDFIQARQQLRERLKNCTEEERRALLQEFREMHREQIQAERELRRQLRAQIHDIRVERRRLHTGG